ncbi:MAG: HAMP domain-containing sensor histidine kinase [Pseudomonadota bacterium]
MMLGNFRLPTFVKTTTFRLALLHSGLFAVFLLGLLVYLYASTVVYIRGEARSSLDAEITELVQAHRQGGLVRLNQSVLERSTVPGSRQFIYLLQDGDGRKISGDLSGPPAGVEAGGVEKIRFTIDYPKADGSIETRPAEGRQATLADGSLIFVAYDIDEFVGIIPRVTNVVWTAAPIGLLMSLIGGIIVSRTAARRADELAKTAEGVMAGDLSRRAPLAGSGDEFDDLAGQLNAMLARIEQLMLSSRHVGDAIAHDLRTPLTRLRNRLESSLASSMSKEETEETLENTLGEVDHVLDTFNAILRLSRLEAGDSGPVERIDMSAIGHELAELFEPACEDAGLEFSADIGRNLFLRGERSLIAHALSNLLDNAIKYTPSPGDIRFEVAKGRDETVVLKVTDTGPGIPKKDRERVVERFVRLETSRSEPGSGLGLALVDAVADLHRGSFVLDDGSGLHHRPGLSATLRLPRI